MNKILIIYQLLFISIIIGCSSARIIDTNLKIQKVWCLEIYRTCDENKCYWHDGRKDLYFKEIYINRK